jgi:hypothetical protein
MDLTLCPECDAVAEIRWRDVMESTDGPVEHVKVLCSRRHWFLLPVATLERPFSAGLVHNDRADVNTTNRQADAI